MKIKPNIKTFSAVIWAFAVLAATALGSCVRDDLYDTSHPDHGKITVSADWTARGEEVPEPEKWIISVGDYIAEETESTHEAQRLFEPGSYCMITYTAVDGITVTGTTATVAPQPAGRGSTFINENPGWFLTGVQDITVEKDREHLLAAPMRQQVRQLTLLIEPTGNAADAIESIPGSLSGIAGTLDFATDTYGAASDIRLDFTKITEGSNAGKWAATVRLLGIAGDKQLMSATVTFAGGSQQPVIIESDLSEALAGFNNDKTVSLTLGGAMVETSTSAGMTATIDKWEVVDGGNIDAH